MSAFTKKLIESTFLSVAYVFVAMVMVINLLEVTPW